MIEWRRRIHAHPELSFQEFATARLVAEELGAIEAMEVQTEVGGTGVIGTLSGGPGPCVALRADMDALPITEANRCSYRSRRPGVMHACGHDAHTAILLGTARLLGEELTEGGLPGTVRFLFQPAEEDFGDDGRTGAPRMIREGALEGVDAVLALHMNPGLPHGSLQVNDGYTMAGLDTFRGTLSGTGGHAAYPHRGTDPTWLLLPVLQALHGIVARRVSPMEPAVVSVGRIHAGTASNVIPSEVEVEGTFRSYDPDIREGLIEELERAFSLAASLGGDYSFRVERGEPALKNDARVNRRVIEAVRTLFPDCKIHQGPFGMGAEDFSHMTAVVPGSMFFPGCALPDGIRDLHTPYFDIDERCLSAGAAIMAESALRLLQRPLQEGEEWKR
ncbi:M20 metallopeptidase family protein [Paludifilum halophilum]|uniref:M20 metallopeptidase family protein n=1 Tax=Paludifilum halophilum TaxID=1642702 RepID=UPI001F0A74E6|nr:amidohydrolase [Paludifilum halophilum]